MFNLLPVFARVQPQGLVSDAAKSTDLTGCANRGFAQNLTHLYHPLRAPVNLRSLATSGILMAGASALPFLRRSATSWLLRGSGHTEEFILHRFQRRNQRIRLPPGDHVRGPCTDRVPVEAIPRSSQEKSYGK